MSLNIIMLIHVVVNLGDYYAHKLVWWATLLVQCYTNGHILEVEQAPFAPAIARYYLLAILSMENDLSQNLDLEAVAFAAS